MLLFVSSARSLFRMEVGDGKARDSVKLHGLKTFLGKEAGVQAVLVDEIHDKLTLATIGEIDEEQLKRHLAEALSAIDVEYQSLGEQALVTDPATEANIQIKKLPTETLLEKRTCPSGPLFWRWREMPWPELTSGDEEEDWRLLAVQAGICGVAALAGFVLSFFDMVPQWHTTGLYIVAMIAGGWDAAIDAVTKLRKGELDIHFLMIAVAVGASAIGAYGEGALLLFLFSFSGALENFALYRTRNEINSLIDAAPKMATVIDDEGNEQEIEVERLQPGQQIRIRTGDAFPVDAEIVDGRTAADESNLTGEATPVPKESGDQVFSGTVNLWGAVTAKVSKRVEQSALQRIIRLIRQAQHLKAPAQRFTDLFGTRYTWLVLFATTAMFFVWWLLFKLPAFTNTADTYSAFYRAMTLLVVASPCALVLSIPSAILAAIAWGARHGVLFRGGAAVEKLAQVDVVALDKTGTLTTGDLEVVAIESLPGGREQEIAELAYSLERHSTHPIARAITAYGRKQGLASHPIEDFRNLGGKGVKGKKQDAFCALGRRELLEKSELGKLVQEISQPGGAYTEVWAVHEDLLGRILLKDRIRTESHAALAAIREAGMKPVMLTGDRQQTALEVARSIGLNDDEVRAGLSPDQKVAAVRELGQGNTKVAMIGDGVNDAPSLAAAFVSVAMGARGSDSALEQSEVILMEDRIENFLAAHSLSCSARHIIRQNLVVALGTVVVMVLSSIAGLVPLTLGVFAHEGSTVLVCLNSLRLLFLKK